MELTRSMNFRPSNIPSMMQQHLFDPKAMHYWNQDGANYPTQLLGKLLAVKTFQGEIYRDGLSGGSAGNLAGMLEEYFFDRLTYAELVNLLRRLYDWAVKNGLPEDLKIPGQEELWDKDYRKLGNLLTCDGWWLWLYPMIAWQWIAARITSEFQRHQQRREDRALELYWGYPKEQLERWPNDKLND